MVAIGVFYPVVINTVSGVLQIPKMYLDVGNNFGASRWKMFTTIALPGALPFIMTGIKLGAGMGLILIAIAEMIGAQSGLGYMIWNAWQILSVNTMYVGLIMIADTRLRAHPDPQRSRAAPHPLAPRPVVRPAVSSRAQSRDRRNRSRSRRWFDDVRHDGAHPMTGCTCVPDVPSWYGRRMFAVRAMMTTTIMIIPLGEGECRSVLV